MEKPMSNRTTELLPDHVVDDDFYQFYKDNIIPIIDTQEFQRKNAYSKFIKRSLFSVLFALLICILLKYFGIFNVLTDDFSTIPSLYGALAECVFVCLLMLCLSPLSLYSNQANKNIINKISEYFCKDAPMFQVPRISVDDVMKSGLSSNSSNLILDTNQIAGVYHSVKISISKISSIGRGSLLPSYGMKGIIIMLTMDKEMQGEIIFKLVKNFTLSSIINPSSSFQKVRLDATIVDNNLEVYLSDDVKSGGIPNNDFINSLISLGALFQAGFYAKLYRNKFIIYIPKATIPSMPALNKRDDYMKLLHTICALMDAIRKMIDCMV